MARGNPLDFTMGGPLLARGPLPSTRQGTRGHRCPSAALPPTHLHKERQDGHTDHAAQAVAQGQGPGLLPPLRLATRKQRTSLAESPATAAARPLLWLPGISQLPGLAQALKTWRPLRLPEEGLLLPLGHLLGSQHLQAPCA